jgi:hypothetical protein
MGDDYDAGLVRALGQRDNRIAELERERDAAVARNAVLVEALAWVRREQERDLDDIDDYADDAARDNADIILKEEQDG